MRLLWCSWQPVPNAARVFSSASDRRIQFSRSRNHRIGPEWVSALVGAQLHEKFGEISEAVLVLAVFSLHQLRSLALFRYDTESLISMLLQDGQKFFVDGQSHLEQISSVCTLSAQLVSTDHTSPLREMSPWKALRTFSMRWWIGRRTGHSAVYNCDAVFATSEHKTAFQTRCNATELFSRPSEMWTFAVCTHACCLPVTVCLGVHTECARPIFSFCSLQGFIKDFACPCLPAFQDWILSMVARP